jgi:predicted membrane channel-forming protein YqfA (hemolysin III family)
MGGRWGQGARARAGGNSTRMSSSWTFGCSVLYSLRALSAAAATLIKRHGVRVIIAILLYRIRTSLACLSSALSHRGHFIGRLPPR